MSGNEVECLDKGVLMALRRGPKDLVCSNRGCERPATFAITWSNPTLPFGRAKHWLACDEHRITLEKYLAYRDFPQSTRTLAAFLSSEDGREGGEAKSTGVHRG
ncbi:hypothetical protein [Actinomyces minihominis]|uniref:hypothetical protein n=1 Tax=Actinomyces minihominis TaxID=2002838 RepID=UPI001A9337A7|nr:hypothetical protein [Actinomyces minihominis]